MKKILVGMLAAAFVAGMSVGAFANGLGLGISNAGSPHNVGSHDLSPT